MTDKLIISDYTWRSREMQIAAYPSLPAYELPRDLSQLLRPTTRKELDRLHCLSLGCIAETEEDFRSFIDLAKKRGATVVSKEEEKEFVFQCRGHIEAAVVAWKAARINGVKVVGGKRSADLRKAQSKKATDAIKDRWGMPSKIWPTSVLLKEANAAINKKGAMAYLTAVKSLGPRPIKQYNYRGTQKRKAQRERQKEGASV